MNLSTIVNRIRDFDGPIIGQNVGAAAEQEAAIQECFIDGTYEGPLPLAFVLGGPDLVNENTRDGGVEQVLVENFGIMVAFDARADKEGLSAYENVDPVRNELWQAILGWAPTGYDYPIEYSGSEVIEHNRAFLLVLFQFRATKIFDEQSGADPEEIYGPFCSFQRFWGDVVATHALTGAVDFVTAEPATPLCGAVYMATTTGTSNITATPVVAWTLYQWNGTAWNLRPWDIVAQTGFTDTFVPLAVAITGPTADPTFCTSLSTLALCGTAVGTMLGTVTWANATNLCAGTATLGTGTWTVASVPLALGTNVITVTAHADDGSFSRRDTLTVTRQTWTALNTYDGTVADLLLPITSGLPRASILDLSIPDGPRYYATSNVGYADTAAGFRIESGAPSYVGSGVVAASIGFPVLPTAVELVWKGTLSSILSSARDGLYFGAGVTSHVMWGDGIRFSVKLNSSAYSFQVGYSLDPTYVTGEQVIGSWGFGMDPSVEHEYKIVVDADFAKFYVDGVEFASIDGIDVLASVGTSLSDIVGNLVLNWVLFDITEPGQTDPEAVTREMSLSYQ